MVMRVNDVWINAKAVRPTCPHVCEGYVERSSCWNRGYRRVSRQAASFRERFPPKRAQAVARRLVIGGSVSRRRGGARARPPVFPRTMPNGAFVKVSSFTADAGAAAAARRAPQPGSDNRLRRSDRRSTEVVLLFHRPLPPPPLLPPRIQDSQDSLASVLQVNLSF